MKISYIEQSDPDITRDDINAVIEALSQPRLSNGPIVEAFETAFAHYTGRKYAVAVSGGGTAMLLILKALGIGEGDEVICSSYSWRELNHAVVHAGGRPVFADIDYWSGSITAEKVASRITPKTQAIIVNNPNGHPAPWQDLRDLADEADIALIEDSSEAIGSRYKGALVGTFGDCSLFDFSQPSALACGEGAMIVSDDIDLIVKLRALRGRQAQDRFNVSISCTAPLGAAMSEITAALGMSQLSRLEGILLKRKRIEHWYMRYVQAFEGIKPAYIAPDVDEVHWLFFMVHLGTRFDRGARDSILGDLRTEHIEAHAYCRPLHLQGALHGSWLQTRRLSGHRKNCGSRRGSAVSHPSQRGADSLLGRHHEGICDQRRGWGAYLPLTN